MDSYYQFLGVTADASSLTIEEAVEKKRNSINPAGVIVKDLPGPSQSRLRVLEAASRTLLNPDTRALYDKELSARNNEALTIGQGRKSGSMVLPKKPLSRAQSVVDSCKDLNHICQFCGAPYPANEPFCSVCGTKNESLSNPERGGTNVSGASKVNALDGVNGVNKDPGVFGYSERIASKIGWGTVRGTVINADAPYQADNEFILWRFLLKWSIIGLICWWIYLWIQSNLAVLAIVGVAAFVLMVFAAGIAGIFISQLLAMMLSMRLFGREKQITVRDIRLRDSMGREHLVRFRGELRSGQATPGDEIQVTGKNRHGTIMARWGYNFRTRSKIRVKYR